MTAIFSFKHNTTTHTTKINRSVFSITLVLVALLASAKIQAQSGGWESQSTVGTTGYNDHGNGVIQLLNTTANGCVGSAIHETTATYDPTSGTTFSKCYQVFFGCPGNDNIGSDTKGDGMAFSFSKCGGYNVNNGLACGGGLGYYGACPKMITIEFDTWSSQGNNSFDATYGGGTSGNHDEIALHRDGNASDAGRITSVDAGNLEDGLEHAVCITYVPATHLLSVSIDGITAFTYDFTGSPYDLQSYFGAGGLNQSWSAGKNGATDQATVSNNALIKNNVGVAFDAFPTLTIADQKYCVGGVDATFDAGVFAAYAWSNKGSGTARSTKGNTAGLYTCTVSTASGCSTSASGTLTVNDQPLVTFSLDDNKICKNDPIQNITSASPAGGTFSGSGVIGSTYHPTAASVGSHLITYSYTDLNGCSNSASDTMKVLALPSVELGTNISICDGDASTKTLTALFSGNKQTLWSTGATATASINIHQSGSYWIQVTDSLGCAFSDTIEATPYCDELPLEWPNVITPNGDDKNEVFKPFASDVSNIHFVTFSVYNRWGVLLFTSQNSLPNWDAKVNGTLVAAGTYYYVIQYKTANKSYEATGYITVL